MLRKHINLISKDKLKELPFYSWNCITLKTKRRDIDIVIKDTKTMKILIKFLVYSLYTLDGYWDTTKTITDEMNEASFKKFSFESGIYVISDEQKKKLIYMNEYNILEKICRKYTILSVR